jgi:hypothetical protein
MVLHLHLNWHYCCSIYGIRNPVHCGFPQSHRDQLLFICKGTGYKKSYSLTSLISITPRRHRASGSIAPPFLTSEADGDEWSASCSCQFFAGETASCTHRIGGRVAPKAGLDVTEKKKYLTLAGNRILGRSVRSLVTVPTELSRLVIYIQTLQLFCC